MKRVLSLIVLMILVGASRPAGWFRVFDPGSGR